MSNIMSNNTQDKKKIIFIMTINNNKKLAQDKVVSLRQNTNER